MPRVNQNKIFYDLRRVFGRGYKGEVVKLGEDIPAQARAVFDRLKGVARLGLEEMSYELFEAGLRRALLWDGFKREFHPVEEVLIPPFRFAQVLSGNILAPDPKGCGPIYMREEVEELPEAQKWITRFLYVMEHLRDVETFDLQKDPRAFYVRGPQAALAVGQPNDPVFSAATFPQFDLPDGKFVFVRPVFDNLAALQFRVLDPQERVLKKYAYNNSVPEKFSPYSYADEEVCQFGIFNKILLTEEERCQQTEGLNTIRQLCLAMLGSFQSLAKRQDFFSQDVRGNFKLAGPARSFLLSLTLNGVQEGVNFYNLHLEPEEVYEVSYELGEIPSTKKAEEQLKTVVVTFASTKGHSRSKKRYFIPVHGAFAFCLVHKATIDDKGRVVVPNDLMQRPWDDEPSKLIL